MKKLNTKNMVIAGFLIALNVILSRILVIPGVISFGGFPIIFGGIALGPVFGFIVGAVGDVVSFIVRPTGVFMPHFTLTSALTGFIPGLIVMLLKTDLREPKLWQIFVAILAGQLTTTVLMVPYFRLILFAHPIITTMPQAAMRQAFNIPVYSVVIRILVQALYRAGALQEAHS